MGSLRSTLLPLCSALVLTVLFCGQTQAVAVMSVDLGSEWVKIGVVSVSVTFDV